VGVFYEIKNKVKCLFYLQNILKQLLKAPPHSKHLILWTILIVTKYCTNEINKMLSLILVLVFD